MPFVNLPLTEKSYNQTSSYLPKLIFSLMSCDTTHPIGNSSSNSCLLISLLLFYLRAYLRLGSLSSDDQNINLVYLKNKLSNNAPALGKASGLPLRATKNAFSHLLKKIFFYNIYHHGKRSYENHRQQSHNNSSGGHLKATYEKSGNHADHPNSDTNKKNS